MGFYDTMWAWIALGGMLLFCLTFTLYGVGLAPARERREDEDHRRPVAWGETGELDSRID